MQTFSLVLKSLLKDPTLLQKPYSPLIRSIKLIGKKRFAKTALDRNPEIFVIYITALEIPIAMLIYSFRAFQIQDDPTLAVL